MTTLATPPRRARVELLEGVIVAMAPEGPLHAEGVDLVVDALREFTWPPSPASRWRWTTWCREQPRLRLDR